MADERQRGGHEIVQSRVHSIMRGGRSRWKIENETFNTLKNFGYNFEHNYGHGRKYLSTNLCFLMLLAFMIDQIQGMICKTFQAVKKLSGSFQGLWEKLRVLFEFVNWPSWEYLFQFMMARKKFNTS